MPTHVRTLAGLANPTGRPHDLLFSRPNHTDMGPGGNSHRACSVESVFFFSAVTNAR